MIYLIVGLLLFIGIHCLPMNPAARAAAVNRLGESGYMGLFSLLSLVAIGLIIFGVSQARVMLLWEAPAWGHKTAMVVVPLSLYLVIAAQLPGKTRQLLIHPMLIGVALWGIAHLLANGDATGLLLFGGFSGYSLVALTSLKLRGRMAAKRGYWWADLLALALAALASGLLIHYHSALFGVAVAF